MLQKLMSAGKDSTPTIKVVAIQAKNTAEIENKAKFFNKQAVTDGTYTVESIELSEDGAKLYRFSDFFAYETGRYVLFKHNEGGCALMKKPESATRIEIVHHGRNSYAGFDSGKMNLVAAQMNQISSVHDQHAFNSFIRLCGYDPGEFMSEFLTVQRVRAADRASKKRKRVRR